MDISGQGAVTFTDDLTDVQSISDDGYLKIRAWSGPTAHSVEIRSEAGRIVHTYYVGSAARPWDDEARRWLAATLPVVIRRTGMGAEQRTRSILAAKGVNGVLEEIDHLEGDYVRRLYFHELLKAEKFSKDSIGPVLLKVPDVMHSDYDRRVILTEIADSVRLDGASADAYLAVVGSMKSDYDRRVALTELIQKTGLTPALSTAVFRSSEGFHSDYDRSEVLRQTVGTAQLDARSFTSAVGQMKSDYEKRRVLTDALSRRNLSVEVRKAVLSTVDGMHSDYDRASVLNEFVATGALDAATSDGFFTSVKGVSSDYSRAEVLLTVLNHGALASSARSEFVNAAEAISSQYDQNRVLAALVRSERR